jgi:hypothetical protein
MNKRTTLQEQELGTRPFALYVQNTLTAGPPGRVQANGAQNNSTQGSTQHSAGEVHTATQRRVATDRSVATDHWSCAAPKKAFARTLADRRRTHHSQYTGERPGPSSCLITGGHHSTHTAPAATRCQMVAHTHRCQRMQQLRWLGSVSQCTLGHS